MRKVYFPHGILISIDILNLAPLCRVAFNKLKEDQTLKAETALRQSKYLNNIIEQDHRNVKRIVKPMMGFQSFNTARRALRGIEAMNMIRKGQVKGGTHGDRVYQAKFINEIFGVVA